MKRRTLNAEVRVEAGVGGRGLFTEIESVLTIRPGDDGIAFRVGGVRIPATIEHLSAEPVVQAFAQMPPRHTVLAKDGARVITTEHVLAALVGLGVTDAELVIEGGEEVPIDNGSAAAFVRAMQSVGLTELGDAEPLVITEVITVEDGSGGMIVAEPCDGPAAVPDYSYLLDYGEAAPLDKQTASWSGDAGVFASQVAPARTFSFAAEVEQMRALGLFTSFTPADLLVLDAKGEPIENELRFADEPARHKLLDLIGDLALVGQPIAGRIAAYRSGHALNHEMARRLASAR
ncbi:MAG: UDP-3-O-acyl-N-acetylglucosamine deacetylase [Planctomycetota bacterium]